ncbi:MAG: pseudouridine synthase [Acidobacteria bacterium]|nr:pseudouridine synthase [Acidobacteriota bacterium]
MKTRLNKLLSQAGAASRRLADELIQQGRVEVNGKVVAELGAKADPGVDDIRVDGRRLKVDTARRYLLMNKPRGVLSTRSDPHQRRTVIDLLAAAGIKGYFYPVGRLDYDSEGLILLTNDGSFAEKVMHPRYELERTYEALVVGVPDDRALDRLRHGVVIEDRKTLPAIVRLVRVVDGREGPQAVLELTLREGRNRQVRHMCSAIAHPVDRLKRIRIGGLSDRNLRPGDIRDLTAAEVAGLMGSSRSPAPAQDRRPSRPDRPVERAERRPPRADRPGAGSGRSAPRSDRPGKRPQRPASRPDGTTPRSKRPAPRSERPASTAKRQRSGAEGRRHDNRPAPGPRGRAPEHSPRRRSR